jgi:hypothetical protein
MLSPRQIFEDNIRPADLLLKVFRLLEHDVLNTEADLHRALRDLVKADKNEGLTVIYNEIFLGMIRERADITPASIKRSALCNLLRQSVVIASTAMENVVEFLTDNTLGRIWYEMGPALKKDYPALADLKKAIPGLILTYLPILLREHLPQVIQLRGRDFVPKKDEDIKNQFKAMTFALDEAVRILTDPDPLYIANKMISTINFSYLSGKRGIHVTGALLALDNPWKFFGSSLSRVNALSVAPCDKGT